MSKWNDFTFSQAIAQINKAFDALVDKAFINYFDFANNLTTVITTADTWVKLNADTTKGFNRNGFVHTANRVTNDSGETKIVKLSGIVSLSAGNNQELHASFFKNETIVPCSEQSTITSSGNRVNAVPIQCIVELEQGDFIEVYVKNKTATTDIVCDNVNVIVTEL